MKALSLWQPWASLVVLGIKKVETRSWATDYRGPIIIHSTISVPPPAYDFWRDSEVRGLLRNAGVYDPMTLPMGCYVGVVDLVGIKTTEKIEVTPQEQRLGNYNAGRFAWLLENARELNEPIPIQGHQRLWNPSHELMRKVKEALA